MITLMGASWDKDKIYIITKFVDGKNLDTILFASKTEVY